MVPPLWGSGGDCLWHLTATSATVPAAASGARSLPSPARPPEPPSPPLSCPPSSWSAGLALAGELGHGLGLARRLRLDCAAGVAWSPTSAPPLQQGSHHQDHADLPERRLRGGAGPWAREEQLSEDTQHRDLLHCALTSAEGRPGPAQTGAPASPPGSAPGLALRAGEGSPPPLHPAWPFARLGGKGGGSTLSPGFFTASRANRFDSSCRGQGRGALCTEGCHPHLTWALSSPCPRK